VTPSMRPLRLLVLCSFVSGPALAQELGLDLSDAADAVPLPYRPVIAIVSATANAPSTDAVTATRAKLVEFELVRLAKQNEGFQAVVDPASLAEKLGPEFQVALKCVDWQCMDKVARQAGVHRLVYATVGKLEAGAILTLKIFDPTAPELLTVTEEYAEKAQRTFAGMAGKSQAQKDRDFLKALAGPLVASFKRLTTPNGKLIIDNPDGTVGATLDDLSVGTGSSEHYLPRGPHTVKIKSDAYLPFEQLVTIAAGADATVKVALIAKALDVNAPGRRPAPRGSASIFARPGLYVAAAGLAALIGGLALGQAAKATEAKAATPDIHGIVPITRTEAKEAQLGALLANVLVGAGGAAIAGGGTWLVLSLRTAKPGAVGGSAEPNEVGALIGLGGSF
jgi:hypothetical protein